MKSIYRVILHVTPAGFTRQESYRLFYNVEAWDTDDAENRAYAAAIRERGIWREWATVEECRRVIHRPKKCLTP